MEWTRVKNDINGNSRHVVHFLNFLSEKDNTVPFDQKYNLALSRAHRLGGKRFHNKQYGGGIVFQTCNTEAMEKDIKNLLEKE